jgi:hypothetical protein
MQGTLLVRGAAGATVGFMAAVGRLKFGPKIEPRRHRVGMKAIAAFVLLGLPWLYTVWLVLLTFESIRGRVASADGFLVILSRKTLNPKPTRTNIAVSAVLGALLALMVAVLLYEGFSNVYAHPRIVIPVFLFTLGPVLLSAGVRSRKDDFTPASTALRVNGLFLVGLRSSVDARTVLPIWLAQQATAVVWVADAELKGFYEDILKPWKVDGDPIEGQLVNDGFNGFWGLLFPGRYSFKRP